MNERKNNNIEEDLFRKFLREKQGYDETLITRALHLLTDRSIHASVAAVSRRTESVALRSCHLGVLRKLHGAGQKNLHNELLSRVCWRVLLAASMRKLDNGVKRRIQKTR